MIDGNEVGFEPERSYAFQVSLENPRSAISGWMADLESMLYLLSISTPFFR